MSGADDDYDFDQQWFFEEFEELNKNTDPVENDYGTSLDVPVDMGQPQPRGSSPLPSSSTSSHGHHRQSHQQPIQPQQQVIQQSHQTYQEPMSLMDDMMPSTSDYGMQSSHIQDQQQPPVSQHQQHQMQVVHNQASQQQFETLQPYNPSQGNVVQNHYHQQNSQMYDMDMDFISNEASTSSAIPMECRISQEYGVVQQSQQQYQHHQQQSQPIQNDAQWISMDSSSQMPSQQNNSQQQMTSVVYTTTSQQMQRIPDPGGHLSNQQPQIINNFNSQQQSLPQQQIIQTGINGETILTNMQPVVQQQRIIHQSTQQQQPFEINSSNNYIPQQQHQQITYIDPSGSQQFITPVENNSNNGFHQQQQIMQVIPQTIPIQPTPPKNEPQLRPAPPSKAKAKNTTTRANGKKKNPPAGTETALSKISKIAANSTQVVVDIGPNMQKMGELMAKMQDLESKEQMGYDMSEMRKDVERQLNEILSGAQIDSKSTNAVPTPVPPQPAPPKPTPTPNYPPIAPSISIPVAAASTPQQAAKSKKKPTKAEKQKELQQKQQMAAQSNANNQNVTNQNNQQQNFQNSQQMQPPPQTPIPTNDYRIVSRDPNCLLVEVNGTIMKAIMVKTENQTATYQILGPADPSEIYAPPQNNVQVQMQPPPQQQQQQQKRVQPIKSSAAPIYQNEIIDDASEMDALAAAAVSDVVESMVNKNKKKAPSKKKKASEPPAAEKAAPAQKINEAPAMHPPLPEPTVICVPSTSKQPPPKPKIILPAPIDLAKRVKDKTDIRKRKIADFIKGMKESIGTADVNSPFIDKDDVFNRLIPYGFHYEPDLSEKTMDKYDHELLRHQTYLHDKHKSIESRMKNIFLRDITKQSFDLELNMLLAIDADYEKQMLEKEKQLCQQDPYAFVREGEFLKANYLTEEYITEARNKLNQNKPKNIKLTKGLTFEPSRFDEQVYIQRRPALIKEMEEEIRRENLRKAHPKPPPPPSEMKPPKAVLQPSTQIQAKVKSENEDIHSPSSSSSSLKMNISKLSYIPAPPIRATSKTKKVAVSFTSSSDDSSSDDAEYNITSKAKKSTKSFRSPSPQKDRKSKSPQKTKVFNSVKSLTKEKEKVPIPLDKINNKAQQQPPIKTTIRKPIPPPESLFYPPMNLSNYKIPKIGEAPKPVPPATTMPEILFNEPHRAPLLPTPPTKAPLLPNPPTKELPKIAEMKNVVETFKIKKSTLINNANQNIVSNKEKEMKEKHHHHHHLKNTEKHGDKIRSSSAIPSPNHPIPTNIGDRSQSMNREKESFKAPSLFIKPIFKPPMEYRKEDKRLNEKERDNEKRNEKDEKKKEKPNVEKDRSKIMDTQLRETVTKSLELPAGKPMELGLKLKITKPLLPPIKPAETIEKKPIKLKLNFSKPAQSPSIKFEETEEPGLMIVDDDEDTNEADDANEVSKEAKRKRKEEKHRKKEEKRKRKLEKEMRKQKERETPEASKTPEIPKIQAPQLHVIKSEAADVARSQSPIGGLKVKLSFKKPQPVEAPMPILEAAVQLPPPPKLKVTIPRIPFPLPEEPEPAAKKSKKEKKEKKEKKKESKKRDSSGLDNEQQFDNSNAAEAPPLKIQKLKIKRMATPPPTSSAPPSLIAAADVSAKAAREATAKKEALNLKSSENFPILEQRREQPRMMGQPPTSASAENASQISPFPAFPDFNSKKTNDNSVQPAVDLRSITERILSRCRAD